MFVDKLMYLECVGEGEIGRREGGRGGGERRRCKRERRREEEGARGREGEKRRGQEGGKERGAGCKRGSGGRKCSRLLRSMTRELYVC